MTFYVIKKDGFVVYCSPSFFINRRATLDGSTDSVFPTVQHYHYDPARGIFITFLSRFNSSEKTMRKK